MESKDIIKTLRVNKKLTQKEVSDGAGVSYSAYQKYESGERELGANAVRKLAKFYRISTDELLGMKDFSDDPFATLPLDDYEKSIITSYMMLNGKERDEFMRLVKKIANGAKVKVTIEESEAELETSADLDENAIAMHTTTGKRDKFLAEMESAESKESK